MLQVYECTLPAEAELVRDYLADEGVTAVVQGGDGDTQSALPLGEARASVWVEDEQYDQAVELVEAFLAQQEADSNAAPWTCPNCGEEVEPQFSECWNCGTERK